MRRVQETLLSDDESNAADTDQSLAPAAGAFRNKRLTFAWLDGEAQDVSFIMLISLFYVDFFLHSDLFVLWLLFPSMSMILISA